MLQECAELVGLEWSERTIARVLQEMRILEACLAAQFPAASDKANEAITKWLAEEDDAGTCQTGGDP